LLISGEFGAGAVTLPNLIKTTSLGGEYITSMLRT
jgi:hypothetical protein